MIMNLAIASIVEAAEPTSETRVVGAAPSPCLVEVRILQPDTCLDGVRGTLMTVSPPRAGLGDRPAGFRVITLNSAGELIGAPGSCSVTAPDSATGMWTWDLLPSDPAARGTVQCQYSSCKSPTVDLVDVHSTGDRGDLRVTWYALDPNGAHIQCPTPAPAPSAPAE